MGRPRAEKNHHALPKYVYIRRGWYIYREHHGGRPGKDVKLCPDDATISEVWRRYESIVCVGAPSKTLDWLMQQYLESAQFRERAPKTQKEYHAQAKTLSAATIKAGGTFGQVDAERVTPGVITRYADARKKADGTPAPVAANREIAFLSTCFSWAVARDLLKTNPCKGAERNTERHRTRYVTDAEYQAVYQLAARWPHIQCAMEFAYLCRMRLGEVLDMRESDIKPDGIHVRRTKGSRDNLTLWSPRLEMALALSRSLPMPQARPINAHLLRGKKGEKITVSGFHDIWQPLMKSAVETGIKPFHFHDLKAKGISDSDGDKQQASGHKTAAMVQAYDRKLARVKPAGEK
jgi:integrase